MANIGHTNLQVSAGAEQTASTSRELARLAEQQQRLVGRFKVGRSVLVARAGGGTAIR